MAEGNDHSRKESERKNSDKKDEGPPSPREIICYSCREKGHIKKNCPSIVRSKPTDGKPSDKKTIICYYCQDEGHVQANCPVKFAMQMSLQEAGQSSIITQPKKKEGAEKTEAFYFQSLFNLLEVVNEDAHYLDTHCHLEYVFERYHVFVSEHAFKDFMLANQYPKGFDGCISTFCDPTAFSALGAFDQILKDEKTWATFGIHPHNSRYYTETLKAKLCDALMHPKCVALGEIGLDYSEVCPSDKDTQIRVLKDQLQLATLYKKPVQIHCRNAEDELMNILLEELPKDWRIHLHCYTGSAEKAVELISTFPHLYIGITGSVTVKRLQQVRDTVEVVPLDRLVLETDSPYMIPLELKEKIKFSHPIMVLHVAEKIAKLKKLSINEVLKTTRENARKIFGI